MKRTPFIENNPLKYTEVDREWIAYQTSELKRWRKATAHAIWVDKEMSDADNIPDTILMTDSCLVALAKGADDLQDETKLREFLQRWPQLSKYTSGILKCLHQSSHKIATHGETVSTKAMRKEALRSAWASKKTKYMDDPKVAKAAEIEALRDQWLLKHNKITPALKARLKKAKAAEQKQQAAKKHKKATEKGSTDVRRLALSNRRIGAFKEVLSDPAEPSNSTALFNQTLAQLPQFLRVNEALSTASQQQSNTKTQASKQADIMRQMKASRNARTPSLPPQPSELIRPAGRRTVRVTAKTAESTPSKQMRASTSAVKSLVLKRVRSEEGTLSN